MGEDPLRRSHRASDENTGDGKIQSLTASSPEAILKPEAAPSPAKSTAPAVCQVQTQMPNTLNTLNWDSVAQDAVLSLLPFRWCGRREERAGMLF